MKTEFDCTICKKHIVHDNESTTGYGIDKDNKKVCFECCGYMDKAAMILTGKATLYLSDNDTTVTNWPGTLRIPVNNISIGRHNMAGKRYDVRFYFNDRAWHGVQYGDNTQILHCRQLKEVIKHV